MTLTTEENRTVVVEKTTFLHESGGTSTEKHSVEIRGGGRARDLHLSIQPRLERVVKFRSPYLREFLAETLGTFLLVLIGCSSVAQFKFNGAQAGTFLSVNLGFGLAVTVAVLVVGKVSGCHINPAVSLAMFLTGRLSGIRFLIYVAAQLLGAFLGALGVFVLYYNALAIYPTRQGGMYGFETAGEFLCNSNLI